MPFGTLWLPVVISAVVVWFASALAHMVLRHHRADYRQLPNEDGVRAALRKGSPAPGFYVTPYAPNPAQMKDPEVLKRYTEGPVAMVIARPNGLPSLGPHLAQWFALCFFVSFTAAYVARHTLAPAADGLLVLRITGAVAFAGYALGYVQDSIWRGIPWSNSLRGIADASAYSVLTGLVFRLLWPAA